MEHGLTTAAAAVFWTASLAVAYAYLGYPLLLTLLTRAGTRARSREAKDAEPPAEPQLPPPRGEGGVGGTPMVSVIIAAYNEADCIAEKVANVLGQDYPADRLEVVVVSDGSTDDTEAIVRALEGPRVRLVAQGGRQGKNLALNRGVESARGEVLVFTDADAMLAAGALGRLVAPFADAEVGLTSGLGLYAGGADEAAEPAAGAYVRYECLLKRGEGALGFLAAADGALYAVHRDCWRTLLATEVHDLVHPMDVALLGRRCVFVPGAVTVEAASAGSRQEFRRQVRIIAQGLLALVQHAPRLAARGRWRELWMLGSHRALRWASGPLLVAALGANLLLLGSGGVYGLTLAAQAGFYTAALAGAAAEALSWRVRLLALPYYFCVVSVAGMAALVDFARGRTHASWAPAGGR